MADIKPCPFCGGEPYIASPEPTIHRYPGKSVCMICGDCDLLFGYDVDYGGIYKTEEALIEAWNNREDGDWE